ncbi:UDP-N-acetylmuramate dehydrogenase [Sulfurimonas sp.]|uniref:UDP-N-acetylmuramate dehydrogenase n=1 Tax=Sulfurimonas sp. TaxID=2022749 RepID=UPI002B49DD20|nr:UDP-N-acetylmuramate dehydrogenase [Sulfurimonas sp.]
MSFKRINFSTFSSIKIGQSLDVKLLEEVNDFTKEYYLIGSCNNILLGNNPPKLMKLSKIYDYIKIEDAILKIGGATPSGKIASFCKKNNITNFEFVSHLPGTLGGLVFMNAGLKEYEIFNQLISIKTCNGKKLKKDIDFGYRYTNINSPILEASFHLNFGFNEEKIAMFKKMRLNQPSTSSAGSCFKNPKGDYAGRLIEEVGLKGKRIGDMGFSTKHANFLVNHGNGIFEDAISLIKEAQKKVYKKFNIWLKCEVKILDKNFMSDSLSD